MDQGHTSGNQAHERRFLHGIARGQLLVEPREGVGGDRGAVEERGGGDGYGCTEECKGAPCHRYFLLLTPG